MDTVYLHHPINASSLKLQKSVMALGYFDGMHKGHQKVIRTAKEVADKLGISSAVMTFNPHPKEVLTKQAKPFKYITPLSDKIEKINSLGIDTVYVVEFTPAFAKLDPQTFVDDYLIDLGAVHVVAGFDFTYGAYGKGTMATLPYHACERLNVTIVDKCEQNHEKVSSTKVRQLLADGLVEKIPFYLGEPYQLQGTVIDGDKRGRTIGFPTANIKPSDRYLIPKTGVYAVKLYLSGVRYLGVCNVGFKPTFHEERPDEPSIEVHLFDFQNEIYGEKVIVEWCLRIRDEQKFSGIDELVAQIHADKQAAITFFAQENVQHLQ